MVVSGMLNVVVGCIRTGSVDDGRRGFYIISEACTIVASSNRPANHKHQFINRQDLSLGFAHAFTTSPRLTGAGFVETALTS
jgi:hypothetical protein